jgi:hypothetical protein
MPFAQGMRQAIFLLPESAFKTLAGTVTADKVPVINPSFRPIRNQFQSNALTGSPEPRAVILGKVGVEWDAGIECNPSSLDPWLTKLCGTRVSGGSADLFHRRYNLGDMSSFAVEDSHADLVKFLGYRGLYVGSGSFQFATEGAMEAQVSGLGAKALASVGATVINSTITDRTTLAPFSYLYGRVKKNGATIGYVKTATLDINRNLGRDMAMDETNELAVIFSEIASVGGRITALFSSVELYDEALGDSAVSLEFWIPYGLGQGFLVILPSVVLQPFAVQTNGTGLCTLEGSYTAQGIGTTAGRVWSKYFTSEALNGLTLRVKVDGAAAQVVTFAPSDDTPEEAAAAVNAQTTGCTASVLRMVGETGGVLSIASDLAGSGGSIEIEAASTAEVLLGIDNAVHTGLTNVSMELWLFNKVA